MSMFAKYKKEREGKEVIESGHGFVVYYYPTPDTVYIEDIFVELAARCEGEAAKMADHVVSIAKKIGCTKLLGSVFVPANGSTASLKVLLAYGMKLHSVDGQLIYFVKEI